MNANLILMVAVATFVVAVATFVVAVVTRRIARRPAVPAPAPRSLGEAVASAHNSLDEYLVRTVDVVAAALTAAAPAPIYIGAGAPTPSAAPGLEDCKQHLAAMQSILDAL